MKSYYGVVGKVILSAIYCSLLISPQLLLSQEAEIPITTSSEEAFELFLEGRDKLENLEIAAAALLFDEAIENDPDFALAYLYRSQSGGGFEVARENLENAISLVDIVSEGEKHLILCYQAQSERDGSKAKEHLDQLLKLFPDDKRVQNLAGIYFQYAKADFETALQHYLKATELDSNYAPAYNLIGYAHSASGNYEAAEQAFKTYIALIPDRPNPYDSYAELLLKIGRFDESIEQYRLAFEKDTLFTGALKGIGDNYVFKGDFSKAREYYQKQYDRTPVINGKLGALFWKALSYVYEGNIVEASNVLEQRRTLSEEENLIPNLIGSYNIAGLILTESGNPEAGMEYYGKASELMQESELPDPVKEGYSLGAMLSRCHILIAKNEIERAKAEADKCKQKLESRQNPFELRRLNAILALLELKQDNYDEALEYFSEADTEDPYNWYYMAVAYEKKGDKENASKLFAKIAGWNENSLGLALVRQRAIDKTKK